MADRTVRVRLEAAVAGFNTAMARSSQKVRGFGGRVSRTVGSVKSGLRSLGPVGIGAGAALAAGFADAIGSAVEFEESVMKLRTQIGLTADQAEAMADASRQVGTATGIGAQEAVDASWQIASAGLRGAEAMEVMERAAQASRIGLGETRDVADLVTSAINAYGSENLNASDATDILTTAVREGKAEASEMAGSMGQVLPIASEMQVSFEQVAGVQAAMTRTGTDARTAATQLRQVLMDLMNPADKAQEALADVGLSAEGIRATIREQGLFAALSELKSSFEGNEEAMGEVFGNARSLMGVLDLMGSNAEANSEIMDALGDSTGALDEAIEQVEDTTADKTRRMKAQFEELKISVADHALPAINFALEDMNRTFEEGSPGNRMFTLGLGSFRDDILNSLEVLGAFGEESRQAHESAEWIAEFLPDAASQSDGALMGLRGAATLASGAMDEGAEAAEQQAEGLKDVGEEAGEATPLIEAYTEATTNLIGVHLDAASAELSFLDALQKITDGVEDNGTSLDKNTEKGRNNRQAIINAAEAAVDHGEKLIAEGASADEATEALDRHIGNLKEEMEQAGFTQQKISDLIDEYGLVPEDIITHIETDGDQAEIDLRRFLRLIDDIPHRRTVEVSMRHGAGAASGGQEAFFHQGGIAGVHRRTRPGHRLRSDEIPAVLQRGEEVLTQDDPRHVSNAVASQAPVPAPPNVTVQGGGGSGVTVEQKFYTMPSDQEQREAMVAAEVAMARAGR